MYFFHSDAVWDRFSKLRALTLVIQNVAALQPGQVDVSTTLAEVALLLDGVSEGELPSIQAWRRAYAEMGLKPTQYRCAAEALLRRIRKDRTLPRVHPLIDLLNAESARAGIPIAAFDIARVVEGISVRPAVGDETYETFQGELEHPAPGEIIFADAAGKAHSRRWVFRQGATSVLRGASDAVLVVAEAMHDTAATDLTLLKSRLMHHAVGLDLRVAELALLDHQHRRFEYAATGSRNA